MCIQRNKQKLAHTCYSTIKTSLFLFLLVINTGCGGGGGAPISAVNVTQVVTTVLKATTVNTDSAISVSFDTNMDPATINKDTYLLSGPNGVISGSISYDSATRTALFLPNAPLLPQTTYTATLTFGIKSANGQMLSGENAWNLRTGKDSLERTALDSIPATLFGMHMHYADTTTTWPAATFGIWRLWDAWVGWPWLEPNKGEWNFAKLDQYVAMAESKNVGIVLPLGLTPTWASARPTEFSPYHIPGAAAEPANIADWKNYVRTVATRYKGRIHYYELWNEVNIKDFYSGSPEQMVVLAREMQSILKEIDPSVTIISPSCTGIGLAWFDQYIAKGGADYADIIGYHFYVSPNAPESMLDLINKVKSILSKYNYSSKKIWNTEAGWYIQNSTNTVSPGVGSFSKVISSEEASAYIARSYVLNWASGIDNFSWYAWDNSNMGLLESDNMTEKTAASAYVQTYKWLVGAKMISCGKNSQGIWVSQIVDANNLKKWIIWNADSSANFQFPEEWRVTKQVNLSGAVINMSGTSSTTVGPAPIMLVGD